MAKWLSKEWMEKVALLSATQPERLGVNLRLQFKITDTQDGDILYFWDIVNGQLARCELGEIEDPEVTLIEHSGDAYEIQMGNLDMTDAFMQGKINIEGDITKLMSLLPITNSEEFQAFQREVAAVTNPM
ncbi:MAG: SCP2 sterol-binding domain-containing protein [Firmicutes bacterium]|nr:SCP2 sterol-binding domain-containing protein [Bacillota bacterium]